MTPKLTGRTRKGEFRLDAELADITSEDTEMSEMAYELKQLHENAGITTDLFAVRIATWSGKSVPTVIIVTDTLNSEQEEEARKHLWAIAEILRNASGG